MSHPMQGAVACVVFGLVSVAMMLPMEFPDKRAAMLGAFLNRFVVGFVVGCVSLPWPGWAVGCVRIAAQRSRCGHHDSLRADSDSGKHWRHRHGGLIHGWGGK